MNRKRHSLVKSFNFAISGIIAAVKAERNMKIHLVMALLALLFGILFDLSRLEFMVLFLSITLVIALELVNTSIEKAIDLCTTKYHPFARIAKDTAAAAVFVVSLNAVIVGWFLFGHRLAAFSREPLRATFVLQPVDLTIVGLLSLFILVIFLKGFTNAKTPLAGGWPSGHAAMAFAMATSIAFYSESVLIIVLAFALALLVGQSRVEGDIHNLTEVMAGSLLGIFVMAFLILLSKYWSF